MNKFPLLKIEDCCEILDNRRVPVSEKERKDRVGTIPYYGANGINGTINDYIFDEPLILIAEDGGHFDEFETQPIAFAIRGKSWVNNHAHVLRAKAGFVQSFIFYCLENKDVNPFIKGGTRLKLNQSELRQMTIPIPPHWEQSKIAQILTTIDTVIKKTQALIDKYEWIKKGLIHELFTQGVDPQGLLRPPHRNAPHLYQCSELGWVPREWQVVPLKKITHVTRGKFSARPRDDLKYYGGEHPFIQTSDITHAAGQYLSVYRQSLNDQGAKVSKQFPKGAILVTMSANIADTAILTIPMYAPDSVAGVVVHPGYSERFVELALRRNKSMLNNLAPQSAQKNINLEDLKPLLIPLPTPSEQIRIAHVYESLESLITLEHRYLCKLRKIKSGLRQDLLSGKVRFIHACSEAVDDYVGRKASWLEKLEEVGCLSTGAHDRAF